MVGYVATGKNSRVKIREQAADVGGVWRPIPLLHHEQDNCRACFYRDVPKLMSKLAPVPRKELVTFRGGENEGDPCEAMAYHGYNGLEKDVVARIADWIAR